MFSNKGLQRLGDVFQHVTCEAFNRTGQTLVKGLTAMMDFAATQAETDSITLGDDGNPYANLTPVTAAGLAAGYPVVVALDDSLADNQKGKFLLFGHGQVATLDDDAATTNADQGEAIGFDEAGTGPDSFFAVQGAIAASNRLLGIFHEDAEATGGSISTPDTTEGAELKFCLWTGGIPMLGVTQDA